MDKNCARCISQTPNSLKTEGIVVPHTDRPRLESDLFLCFCWFLLFRFATNGANRISSMVLIIKSLSGYEHVLSQSDSWL